MALRLSRRRSMRASCRAMRFLLRDMPDAHLQIRLTCPDRGRGLSEQVADGRFVGLVASHKLLHDRLGQELIKRQLVGSLSVQNIAAPHVPAPRPQLRRCHLPRPQPAPLCPRPDPCRPPVMLLSSMRDGELRRVEAIHAGGVAASDLGLFIDRHPSQDLRQDFPRLGEGRLAVRIVRAPHHIFDADDVA